MDDKKFSAEDIKADKQDLFLPLLTALLTMQPKDNTELEKEVAYLRGRLDTLEKLILR